MRVRLATACGAIFVPECYMAHSHSRTATNTTLSQLAGPADGAAEEQDRHAADGGRRELQQEAIALGLATSPAIDEGLCSLLRLCRETVTLSHHNTRPLWFKANRPR